MNNKHIIMKVGVIRQRTALKSSIAAATPIMHTSKSYATKLAEMMRFLSRLQIVSPIRRFKKGE